MTGNWTRWFGDHESRTIVTVFGKSLEVSCSASAERALEARESPLVVELTLAFACVARKEMRFRESSGETGTCSNLISVNGALLLRIATVVPDACETPTGGVAGAPARNFIPRWLRIDRVKGGWVGDYGW